MWKFLIFTLLLFHSPGTWADETPSSGQSVIAEAAEENVHNLNNEVESVESSEIKPVEVPEIVKGLEGTEASTNREEKVEEIQNEEPSKPVLNDESVKNESAEEITAPEAGNSKSVADEESLSSMTDRETSSENITDVDEVPLDDMKLDNRTEPLLSEEPSQPEEENKTAAEGIPSFSEWTKQQLQKKQSLVGQQPVTNGNGNVNNGASQVRDVKKEDGKNFASPDCGAKVLMANPEAQNPSGTLSSSHDEYMLNRCGTSSWIILELCESMKVEKVAVGNLELFSSSPKEIEIGFSDRFPTRDWVKIGPIELPDARAIHAIPMNSSLAYNKYIRVQVLNHHGNEHYCPVSAIRVYGTSEFEVEVDVGHSSDVHEMDSMFNGIGEEEIGIGGVSDKSVIGSATNGMFDIISKAAKFLNRGSEENSKKPDDCQSITECFDTSNSTGNATEVCNPNVLYFLQRNSRAVMLNSSLCESFLSSHSIGGPSSVEGIWRAVFGEGIWRLMFDYMSPIRNCVPIHLNETLIPEKPTNEVPVNIINTNGNNITLPKVEVPVIPVSNGNGKGPAVIELPPPMEKPPSIVIEKESQVQKESVFVRLTNRIKALEANQSLSSGYLEELSQRFKKQSEESATSIQVLKRSLNDSVSKFKFIEDFSRREATYLRRSIVDLRATLWRTEMQRLFLIFVALIQFLVIVFFCCWTRNRLNTLEDKYSTYVKALTVKPPVPIKVPAPRRESLASITPRKRSNSHPEVTKVKKKKKKKDIIRNLENEFNLNVGSIKSNADSAKENVTPLQPIQCITPPPRSSTIPSNLNLQKPFAQFTFEGTNRFQLLASPSTPHSANDITRVISGSTTSVDRIGTSSINVAAFANGTESHSSESLDSASIKRREGSKKIKLKKLIPKFFDSHK